MASKPKPGKKPALGKLSESGLEKTALTESELKQVSGGGGTVELSSWQMGISQPGPGGSGSSQGKVSLNIKIKP